MGILTLFAGLLVVLSGVFAIANTGITFSAIAFVVGSALVLLGFILFIGYFVGARYKNRIKHTWVLVDGIMGIFLGVLILSNLLNAEIVIPYVLGIWVIYSGILRVAAATNIDLEGKKTNFFAAMGIGILLTAVGSLAFFNPILGLASTAELIGMFLIAQGIAAVELGINSPHSKKKMVYED